MANMVSTYCGVSNTWAHLFIFCNNDGMSEWWESTGWKGGYQKGCRMVDGPVL